MNRNLEKMEESLEEFFGSQKLLPILTVDDKEVSEDLASVMCESGLKTYEVTLRTPAALEVIAQMSSFDNCVVGAGTLISPSDVRSAMKAGAKFGISPGITPELLNECEKNCFPLIPGVSTASEIMNAYSRGYKKLKFFPSENLGGVKTLKALQGPFPGCKFFPTGGINQNNALDYLSLPNVYAVAGSWVAPRELIRSRDWSQIRKIIQMSDWKI